MCLDACDEIPERHVCERRNREFIFELQGLASQSDWTARYPSAGFPTAIKQADVPQFADVGLHAEDATTPWTWRDHKGLLASISLALLEAEGDNGEFAVTDFIVAGSLGKDTAVDHFSTDVDLLVVFKDFDPYHCTEYLKFIEDALLSAENAEDLRLTRRTFPVRVLGSRKSASGNAEYLRVMWKGKRLLELMPGGVRTRMPVASEVDREPCDACCTSFAYSPWSKCCTEFSVEFVGQQPAHVLVAIRALKDWRNALKIEKPQFTLSSFALELLAIATNQEQGCSTSRDVFIGALRVLCRPDDKIDIVWTVYYSREVIPKDILVQRPLVLDPAKPWNNTVWTSNLRSIRPLAKKALVALGCTLPYRSGSVSAAAC